jgi:hypothetical protein
VVSLVNTREVLTTYNFEVADINTYYVSAAKVLVHNCKKTALSAVGRSGKQERLRELANDTKVSSADRGWIKNEIRHVETGNRNTIRLPRNSRNSPHTEGGTQLAHAKGKRAKDGNSYKEAKLQDSDLHRLEHKYEGYK